MLTHLTIRNFKKFGETDFELGDRVVFIGPNNSGKSSALQALALWDLGLKKWTEKRGAGDVPRKRPGVTINRRDLIALPVPDANLLWRNLHVRETIKGKGTQNIRIDVVLEGVSKGTSWTCGFEFDYANEESFYCRPLRLSEDKEPKRMRVPDEAASVQVAFLPPMSGLAATETRLDSGAVNVRLGEGRTAEVLRNLCYRVLEGENGHKRWEEVKEQIRELFNTELEDPRYIPERGEITLSYREGGIRLDISSSGRGLQQTLLLLAHMTAHPGAVLLMDEPDAHLEVLRQRQTYHLLTETATATGSQIIAASHSEVVLNEAADRDMVIAFVGRKPHRMDDRGHQVLKSLKEIGFDQYYQAEQAGWVLYLEGSTDLAILKAFAKNLEHPASKYLERPFVHYVANQPRRAQDHFYGLREAKHDLVGFAIYDRLQQDLPQDPNLSQYMWIKREIENYLCHREVILNWTRSFAERHSGGPLFAGRWVSTMEETIAELEQALAVLKKHSPWSADIKSTDDFFDPLFAKFFEKLQLPNLMRKSEYHELAPFVLGKQLDDEIRLVLDKLCRLAETARPEGEER